MAQPIHPDLFYHDGRGPKVQRVHWAAKGTELRAIDYFNPGDGHAPEAMRHVRFIGAQVVMITPEEVMGEARLALATAGNAAILDLGRDDWLRQFNPHHLAGCRHFRLSFYDELFDVICEEVECHLGCFPV